MDFKTLLYGDNYREPGEFYDIESESDSDSDSNGPDLFEPESNPPTPHIMPQDTGPSWIPRARAPSPEPISSDVSTSSSRELSIALDSKRRN